MKTIDIGKLVPDRMFGELRVIDHLHTFRLICDKRYGATGRLRFQEPLARHGTFGVGGPADVWFLAISEDELLEIVTLAITYQIPVLFAGNGTNVLYSDQGARGLVLQVGIDHWSVQELSDDTAYVHAGAGMSLPKCINELAALGWSGLEWGAGIPGTLGGGVVSNAGCHGCCMGDTLQSVRVLDVRGSLGPFIHEMPVSLLDLAYRQSRFRGYRSIHFDGDGCPIPPCVDLIDPSEIITSVSHMLRRDDPQAIRHRIAQYRRHRKDTQPSQGSAGSVFKNPAGDYSGRLIEAAGLKGYRIGGAGISEKHGNFIVNLGNATAKDIIELITITRNAIRDLFSIDLELELELRGDWSP